MYISGSILFHRSDKMAYQGRFQSIESRHEHIRVDCNRQSWHMSQKRSLTIDRVYSRANRGQSQSTESTHESIRVGCSRQSHQMSRLGRFQSPDRTHEAIRVNFTRQSRPIGSSVSISVNRVDNWAYQGQFESKESIHEHVMASIIRPWAYQGRFKSTE